MELNNFFHVPLILGTVKAQKKPYGYGDTKKCSVMQCGSFVPSGRISLSPGFRQPVKAGHGHHTASAIIAEEALIAAADPTKFPDQFQYGVKPWQAKRLLWNTFNFGGTNTQNDSQLKIDVENV
jgi:hypothetical protein